MEPPSDEARRPGPGFRPGGPGGPGGYGRRGGPDLTTGPIGKTLVMFALPVLGSNALMSLNGSVNAIWVSHSLGPAALTATSNANSIFFLMMGATFGISMAANLMIGQSIGARDEGVAKRVVGSTITFFLVLSLAVGVFGYTMTPAILTAMDTPADAKADAIAYLRVIFMAMPFVYFFNFVMMAQRGTGDSRTPFYFSLLMVALDITFNPLLIMGVGPFPRMGIAGSATSTLIAQSVTLAAILVYLYRSKSILALMPEDWRLLKPDLTIVRTLIFKGTPMAIQMLVISGAALTMMSMVNSYGSAMGAGYGAALQLWTYIQMPAMALGAAVSSMAAQNVGAGHMDRVERVAKVGAGYAVLLSGIPIVIVYILQPWILRAFLPGDSPSLPIAIHINSIVMWGFIPFGVAFIFSGVVRATGSVWPPLAAMVIAMWGVRVPVANILTPYLGSDAVWVAFPLGSITSCVLAMGYYKWGNWRSARLIQTTPHGEAPDTGMGAPSMEDETEIEEQLRRSGPSAPNRPRSEAPVE